MKASCSGEGPVFRRIGPRATAIHRRRCSRGFPAGRLHLKTGIVLALPPAFDPAVYRARNPDIAAMTDAQAHDHWRRHGRAEGRAASALATREDVAALLAGRATVLEMDGSGATDLSAIDRQYAAIIGIGTIERQADLLGHLATVARLLALGGACFLVVADAGRGDIACDWSFTPDSFAAAIRLLTRLGLTELSLLTCRPTPRGRDEFVAVLARTADLPQVTFLQTADADRYAAMLDATRPNVAAYCRRHGFAYRDFLGVKRGFHPWQATYNRIPMLAELLDEGYRGWAVYLDADAFVHDLEFDLVGLLAAHADRAAIVATAGVTDNRWDVNAGVVVVNFGHPLGRRLVEGWRDRFAGLSDDLLRAADTWLHGDNDQDLLHRLLAEEADVADAVLVVDRALMNSRHARFIRQHLRAETDDFATRVRAIAAEVAAIAREDAAPPSPAPAPAVDAGRGDRWSWRLAHPAGPVPLLATAPDGIPDAAAAARAIALWQAIGDEAAGGWTDLLSGDPRRLATEIARIGRSPLGDDMLGGARQHDRARDPAFAVRLAQLAYDRLVSLAEATGAVAVESPESGPWDRNGHMDPVDLFARIEATLDADLSPPSAIGGHLGIGVRDGIVLHPRMMDAIHAAWSLRASGAVRILEVGGRLGLSGFYGDRLGLDVRATDTPVGRAVRAALPGCGATVPPDALPAADTLFDSEGLTGWPRDRAVALLRRAAAAGIGRIVSIGHEVAMPGHVPVALLAAEARGWRQVLRHRHWLRAGFVEQAWIRD